MEDVVEAAEAAAAAADDDAEDDDENFARRRMPRAASSLAPQQFHRQFPLEDDDKSKRRRLPRAATIKADGRIPLARREKGRLEIENIYLSLSPLKLSSLAFAFRNNEKQKTFTASSRSRKTA